MYQLFIIYPDVTFLWRQGIIKKLTIQEETVEKHIISKKFFSCRNI